MSTERTVTKPFKPTLASNRTARSPLAPRVAGSAPASTVSVRSPAPPRVPTARTALVQPKARSQEDATTSFNITPRSTARKGRVGTSPAQDDLPADVSNGLLANGSVTGGMANLDHGKTRSTSRTSRARSVMSERPSNSPYTLSPGFTDVISTPGQANIEGRFFHASDMPKQEPVSKRPETKKTPSFFYANGSEDTPAPLTKPPSPVLSAVSERKSGGIINKPSSQPPRSPPLLSPTLATTASSTPFFTSTTAIQGQLRSPSPSKENIHLSYRKGASQIFGMRPTPPPTSPSALAVRRAAPDESRKLILPQSHRKSPSLSSIDSGVSRESRRRSATAAEVDVSGSKLLQGVKVAVLPPMASPSIDLPTIDTSLASRSPLGSPTTFSPTKPASDLAADARRERKVLDLEISNSSLLAINATLEREVRRQKAELKRFRRLSRAGRFSMNSDDLPRRNSNELETLAEDDESDNDPFGAGDDQDDLSESEDGSSLSAGGSLSPDTYASREHDRLAKDEKRLRVDLERHKELLVQSQAMNQSIKRCMYATEEMIREGKKALEYHVRVSDVKLGGRILSEHDDDEIEIDDSMSYTDAGDVSMESAKGLLDVWSGVGLRDGSEGSADRDSGIEVDKPAIWAPLRPRGQTALASSHDTALQRNNTLANSPS